MSASSTPGLMLPEELLLLAHAPADGRKLCPPRDLEYGLAGAVLAELELCGQVVAERGRPVAAAPAPPEDLRLARALASLPAPGGRGITTWKWIRTTSEGREASWAMGLLDRRALRVERQSVGTVRRLSYPVGTVDLTTPARQRFESARHAGFPDPRSRALAALAAAIGLTATFYPGWGGRQDRRSARRLMQEQWIARAVRRNVRVVSSSDGGGGCGDGGGGCGDGGGSCGDGGGGGGCGGGD
ncbi:GPP34 family phosphoprotein [Streptomyces sp. NPDC026206]|uniref:GPP34 family phosphoprotein n=1 Tax=Streptomyces sp. NPDC026206 TaxID=3157089 RepID=UPI0034025484